MWFLGFSTVYDSKTGISSSWSTKSSVTGSFCKWDIKNEEVTEHFLQNYWSINVVYSGTVALVRFAAVSRSAVAASSQAVAANNLQAAAADLLLPAAASYSVLQLAAQFNLDRCLLAYNRLRSTVKYSHHQSLVLWKAELVLQHLAADLLLAAVVTAARQCARWDAPELQQSVAVDAVVSNRCAVAANQCDATAVHQFAANLHTVANRRSVAVDNHAAVAAVAEGVHLAGRINEYPRLKSFKKLSLKKFLSVYKVWCFCDKLQIFCCKSLLFSHNKAIFPINLSSLTLYASCKYQSNEFALLKTTVMLSK